MKLIFLITFMGLFILTACQTKKGASLVDQGTPQDNSAASDNGSNDANEDDSIDPYGQTPDGRCTEGACSCTREIQKLPLGQKPDALIVNKYKGNEDALGIFKSGGSQNIPVICRASKYYLDNDPSWFNRYFDVQRDPSFGVGLMGTEELSPLYGPMVMGPIIAVLHHAREKGHQEIVNKASQWLKAYWALHALASQQTKINSATVITNTSFFDDAPTQKQFRGVYVGMAGSRIWKGGYGAPNSAAMPVFTWAIDYSPRTYTARASGTMPIDIASWAAGIKPNSQGKIDFGRTVPAQIFGLTTEERDTLRSFVNSNGRNGLEGVLSLIGSYKPACDYTFLRTTDGITTWFGTSYSSQNICNHNKGPHFAATLDNNGRAEYLHPAVKTSHTENSTSYRNGNQICADVGEPTNVTRCLNILGGDRVYEVSWTRADGIIVAP